MGALANRFNQFWNEGVKPIKEKVDNFKGVGVVNNLLATVAGKALDAVQGRVLHEKDVELENKISQINNNLKQQPLFIYNSSGEITGYKTSGGADTVFPFSKIKKIQSTKGKSITADSDYMGIVVAATNSSASDIKINGVSHANEIIKTSTKDVTYILHNGKAGDKIDIVVTSNYVYPCIICK